MNDYCNVFMAYFINDKYCFNELTIDTFKLQDFFFTSEEHALAS